MTSASTLTQSEMRKASDELLHIFLEDHEMNALFIVAICERFVSRNTFIDNFRRLLRFFSTDLKNEVQDSIYLELANFISQKSTFIAREVYRVLEYDHARTKSSRITLADPASDQPFAEPPSQLSSIKPQEDPGFEDEEEIEHDEKFDVLVAQGRKFVEGSKAFEELRKDFRNFVMHQPQPRPRIYSPVLSVHVETILRHSPARWSTAYQSAMAYLAVIGFREPRVPVGHKRIRWENAHGRKLYDDYIEHEPGALDSLQKYLDTYNYQAGTTVTSQAYGSSPLPPCWITRLWDNLLLAKRTPPPVESPAQRNEASNSAQNDVERGENPCRTLHLLCSMVKRRFANGLHQELVTDVTSDRDLFLAIRDSYLRYRGILKPYLSLTTVHSIHFMKFRYGGEEYIDLRCHDDLCERGKQCDCVPPPENTEYEFNPRLPKWSPPIGPQLMMDRFTHPDEIQPDDRWIIDQLPKRAKGKLERATTSSELQEAWGIYFKESLDLVKIWIIVAVGFVLPSLLFGVLWGHLRNDIQGAFGVASVWITCGTVFMGLFASYTWRSWV
ncbi:hypothetical protein K491DRAFT_504801 [Lophiostoma macrostomum CBS 122681]|uniref:Uncharacterized protein n=1 Tax=Lophiostoma macrostomum CBS 122681 TaxID=1314788 RepID=A0A6A6TNE4_9PLEO|nr:hypothetical protein K491DRAFT_504801 [Lophiostoma macrostomum CBS 122681]